MRCGSCLGGDITDVGLHGETKVYCENEVFDGGEPGDLRPVELKLRRHGLRATQESVRSALPRRSCLLGRILQRGRSPLVSSSVHICRGGSKAHTIEGLLHVEECRHDFLPVYRGVGHDVQHPGQLLGGVVFGPEAKLFVPWSQVGKHPPQQ
ncbi:jg15864 [Pararge aegeria aegeria]|uniref:Jg15864 protein n=1 Tax=Pararge aegeria aegeria TaxID=348720 RepID=A0A8S4R6P8_9NEOP|nr:jg15864 [Pararge aegeria aegeria]